MDDQILDAPPVSGLTPNLEKLANEGTRFSNFYVTAPRCTPSRASFFTGIGAAKLHMTYVNESGAEQRGGGGRGGGRGGQAEGQEPLIQRMTSPSSVRELPFEVRTTAEVLRDAGYEAAHFGKWHVGRENPRVHGFEPNDGPNTNSGPGNNREPNPEESASITEKGIAFITENAGAHKPFFLQMSHYGAGREAEVTPESLAEARDLAEKSGVRADREKELVRLAAVRDMDKAIGRVIATLEELGIADNTYIVFSTDHGSPGGGGGRAASSANPPLAGGKGSVREGGVRVPLIIWGPGVKAGQISRVRATGMDVLPTFAEIAGKRITVDPDKRDQLASVEGGSLLPILKGESAAVQRPREEIILHFPHYDLGNGGPASAIFLGDHKLIRNDDTGRISLFDIRNDPREQTDLASTMPERVAELTAKLDAYLKAIDAPMATPNPEANNDAAEKPQQKRTKPK